MSRTITVKPIRRNRLYLDAVVLVHYTITKINRTFSRKTKELLSKIESGEYEGVVSLLALMECTKVIRHLEASINSNCNPRDWKKRMSALVAALLQFKNVRIVEGSPTNRSYSPKIKDLLYGAISWQAYDIMDKYPGRCKQTPRGYKHDGLSACDCLHICIAKAMGCQSIATFDRDFDESRKEIKPFFIQDRIF